MADAAEDAPLSLDQAWAELRLYLQRSKGLCLVFLYSDSSAQLLEIKTRLSDYLAMQTQSLVVLAQAQGIAADMLAALRETVNVMPGGRHPIWLDLARVDMEGGNEWETSRRELLSRLNEWRTWLQESYARPLLVALPLAWRKTLPEVAPDLWHVRTVGLHVPLAPPQHAIAVHAVATSELDAALSGLRQDGAGEHDYDSAEAVFQRALDARQHGPARQLALALVEHQRAAALMTRGQPAAQRALAIALDKLGDTERDAGRGEAALAAYRESLALSRQLREALGESPQVLRDLSIALDNVGQAERDAGQGEAALAAYRESLGLGRQLRQTLGESPQILRDLSVSLEKLGQAERDAGRGEAALAAYRESLGLRRQLRQTLGDSPQVLRDLSFSLNKLGEAEQDAGRGEAALAAYRESLGLMRQLRQALGESPQVLRDLSISLGNMGWAEQDAGRGEAALAAYRESLGLSRQLRQELGESLRVLHDLSISLDNMGRAEQVAGQDEAALVAYGESLALNRQLRQALGESPQVLDHLAVSLERLGALPLLPRAERHAALAEAIALRQRIVQAQPGSARAARRLATAKALAATLNDNSASPTT